MRNKSLWNFLSFKQATKNWFYLICLKILSLYSSFNLSKQENKSMHLFFSQIASIRMFQEHLFLLCKNCQIILFHIKQAVIYSYSLAVCARLRMMMAQTWIWYSGKDASSFSLECQPMFCVFTHRRLFWWVGRFSMFVSPKKLCHWEKNKHWEGNKLHSLRLGKLASRTMRC